MDCRRDAGSVDDNNFKAEVKNKRITILGAGESGTGAAVLAKKKGFDVFVSDNGKIKEEYKKVLCQLDVKWEEGGHSEDLILNADEVVKSPGITDDAGMVVKLREKGIKVISEIEFAGRYTNAKIIGVTGSNGKTTTVHLIYHILNKAGYDVALAGNVGQSFAKQVAEKNCDYYVVELSSFQLDGMYDFRIDIAVLLNITPDHLDRYDNDMQKYVDSKFRITQNLKSEDVLIYCRDDDIIAEELSKRNIKAKQYAISIKQQVKQGAYLQEDQLIINFNNQKTKIMFIQELALQGKHNIYNSMAAGIVSKTLDIRKEVIRESLTDFQNMEHRLEFVVKVYGIEFINDSKATNVNATWYALESMTKPVIWIAGGVDKGNDYSILKDLVRDNVKAIICLGKANKKIHKAFSGVVESIINVASMEEAVKTAYLMGAKGDTILFSPACASFDLFKNYEDRGWQFKKAVREL